MALVFNPFTGTFDYSSAASGPSGTGWVGTVTYAGDLPPADAGNAGQVYLVTTTSGAWYTFNLKAAGLYRSSGSAWTLLPGTVAFAQLTDVAISGAEPAGNSISEYVAGTKMWTPTVQLHPDVVVFNPSIATPPTTVGSTYWEAATRCLATVTGTATVIQHGQELPIFCKNDDGNIKNGQPVRVVAGTGNIPRINFASAATESSSYLIGVATEDIAASPNGTGMVSVFGLCNDIEIPNVAATGETGANWTEGLPVYLSTETGKLTVTKPAAPNHGNFVGSIMNRTGGDGAGAKCTLFVHPSLGIELDEIHDVATGVAALDLLQRNAGNTLWEPKSVSEVGLATAASVTTLQTINTDSKEPTGFCPEVAWGLATVAVVSTTKLRLTINSSNNIEWYWRGTKTTGTTPLVITSTDDKAEGKWYAYSTNGTSFVLSQTPFYINTIVSGALRNDLMVYELYWDNTNDVALWIQPETHGIIMDGATHYDLHEAFGTRYISGLTATRTVATLPTSVDTEKRIYISSGEIHDEDIPAYITHNATPTARFEQSLGSTGTADANYAQIPIYYRSGSDASLIWRKATTTSYLFSPSTANTAFNYNRLNAGTWDYTTASANNQYWNVWVVATTNQAEPVVAIAGRVVNITLSTVQAEAFYNLYSEGLFTEYKLLYRLIYRNTTAVSTAGKATLIQIDDYRKDALYNNAGITSNPSAAQVSYTPASPLTGTNLQVATDELAVYALNNSILANTVNKALYGGF